MPLPWSHSAPPAPTPAAAPAAPPERARTDVARRVVDRFGGRVSRALGIDVDAGDDEIERWFLAATLFGTRISATIVEQTFGEFNRAGIVRIDQARHRQWEDLVDILDIGGYVRYDFRTATRLRKLSERVHERYGGRVAAIGQDATYPAVRDALGDLPGWGPVTVGIFLRELRGVWPGAEPPLDERAVTAVTHLGLLTGPGPAMPQVADLARAAAMDPRDVESGLVRLTLAHAKRMDGCRGGDRCEALDANGSDTPSGRSRHRGRGAESPKGGAGSDPASDAAPATERLVRASRRAGVSDRRVLDAVRATRRVAYVPPEDAGIAYDDNAIPLSHSQVTTQPSLCARMVAALGLTGTEQVLEIGTGYGYQAALLARLAAFVTSVEIWPDLAARASHNLAVEGVENVRVIQADGTQGVESRAPFDAIVVSAAFPEVPPRLVDQLRLGGRLVQPIGPGGAERVTLFERTRDGLIELERLVPARFVRLRGRHGYPSP